MLIAPFAGIVGVVLIVHCLRLILPSAPVLFVILTFSVLMQTDVLILATCSVDIITPVVGSDKPADLVEVRFSLQAAGTQVLVAAER